MGAKEDIGKDLVLYLHGTGDAGNGVLMMMNARLVMKRPSHTQCFNPSPPRAQSSAHLPMGV